MESSRAVKRAQFLSDECKRISDLAEECFKFPVAGAAMFFAGMAAMEASRAQRYLDYVDPKERCAECKLAAGEYIVRDGHVTEKVCRTCSPGIIVGGGGQGSREETVPVLLSPRRVMTEEQFRHEYMCQPARKCECNYNEPFRCKLAPAGDLCICKCHGVWP